MPSFDIGSLLEFEPPRWQCEKCLALFQKLKKEKNPSCPVCNVQYFPTDDYSGWRWDTYLKDHGYNIDIPDIVEHGKRLARIARQFRSGKSEELYIDSYPPLRALLETLSVAAKFVHFTSVGMDYFFVGALKTAAQRVAVRGIVSNARESIEDEVRTNSTEAPSLNIKTFPQGSSWGEMPHQKLIVVDGLLAFKGGANLSTNAWRKAEQGRDMVEVVTDIKEVIELHNRYFSKIWSEFDSDRDRIVMFDEIPF